MDAPGHARGEIAPMSPATHGKERVYPADTRGDRESEHVMQASKTAFSHCQVCQRQLEHTALFCPKCGTSACSWECYVQHQGSHARAPQPAASEVTAVRQQRS